MPYKDKVLQKEAVRKAVQRHRGITGGITKQGITSEGITKYPALLIALADPVKRAKLRRICEELTAHHVLSEVYYGYGDTSVPFDVVSEYLGVLT